MYRMIIIIVHFPQIMLISISSLYELQIALCQVYVASSNSEEKHLLEKLVCFKLHLVPALFIVLLSYFFPFMTCYWLVMCNLKRPNLHFTNFWNSTQLQSCVLRMQCHYGGFLSLISIPKLRGHKLGKIRCDRTTSLGLL